MSPARRPSNPGTVSPLRRLAVGAGSAFATLAVAIILAGLWSVWTYQGPGPAARAGDKTTVVLRRGAGLPEISASLERAGVIRSRAIFVAMAQISGAARRLKAGEYEFASKAPMASVLHDIRDGNIVRHWVTIPEGLTSEAAVEILSRAPELEGVAPIPPEGSILPQTYEVQRGEDRAKVLARMMDARDKLLARLWPQRQDGLPFTTPQEAMTLASIVEKETGLAAERPKVAAVFVNRLRQGMRLESDPTIIYGLTRGRPLGHGITASEKATPNPYSTYQIDGLPPTPIANPGEASIAAVLSPPASNDVYFVADGTGGHVFASTLEQHSANVARWRQIERQRASGQPAAAPVGVTTGPMQGPPK